MVRPLRRPARVVVMLAVLAVAGIGLAVWLGTPDQTYVRAEIRPGPDSTAVLAETPRGDLALAGLREGDRIVAFGRGPVTAERAATADELSAQRPVGDTVRVVYERGGVRRTSAVVAGLQDKRDARRFGLSDPVVSGVVSGLFGLAILAFAVVGLVLFVRGRARGYLASLGAALAAVAGGFGFTVLTNADLGADAGPKAVAVGAALFVAGVTFFSALPAFASAIVRFPDGRFTPPWTRYVGRVVFGAFVAFLVASVVVQVLHLYVPFAEGAFAAVLIGLVALPAVGLVQKYRRSPDTVVRQEMKWVLLPLSAFVVLLVLSLGGLVVPAFDDGQSATGYLFDLATNVLAGLAFMAIPLGVLAGVLGFRPWDADLWIARSAAVGAATLGLAAVFAGASEALRLGLRASMGAGADAVAAALAAVAALVVFNPVREWLTRRADADLVRTRERLGERLPLLLAGRQVVATPAEIGRVALAAVREVFRVDRAAVIDLDPGGWEVVAAEGVSAGEALAWADAALDATSLPPCSVQVWEDPTFVLRVPLRSAEDEVVGVLALGTHGRGRGYSTEERRALDGAARPLAEALRVTERRLEDRAREYERLARLLDQTLGSGDGSPAVPGQVADRLGAAGDP